MRGLYFDKHGAVFRDDLPLPQPGAGESLVRIRLAAICSTDREVLKGYKPDFSGVMGHEFVGVVERSDDAALVGRRVVGELNEGCGHCIYCRTGREKHCEARRVIGLANRDGCFAEYMVIATRLLHPVPDSLTDEQAVYTEPLSAALQIPKQVHIDPDTEICVIGDGRLSYLVAQVLALTGAETTVLGHHAEKLERFRPFAKTTVETDRTYEIVVDACGAPSGIAEAARLVRHAGTIVLKSTYAGAAEIDLSQFVVHEVTIVGSRCGPFAPALRLLERGRIALSPIELHDIADWEQAFASRAFKCGFDFRK